MKTTKEAGKILSDTIELAAARSHEYITPEHFLLVLCKNAFFQDAFELCGGNISRLENDLELYLTENLVRKEGAQPQITDGFEFILSNAYKKMLTSEKDIIETQHLVHCLLDLKESHALYYMQRQGVDIVEFFTLICHQEGDEFGMAKEQPDGRNSDDQKKSAKDNWKKYVECLNDVADQQNPLIGRENELERTIQILCRKEKNNPLHIGEAGVGKTAITYGLARLLKQDRVPDLLKGAQVFAVDLGGMLSGTQYRGDFEKRFKEVMEGISAENKSIVYFDEIHNIVGAGAVNGGSFDVSNMLKPYLSSGRIRFIGATTYEEYKKYFSKSKSLVRRFQNVDIKEPDLLQAEQILEGLKKHYEEFHGVKYAKGVMAYAVSQSAKYMNERCLPDKAIDLIDEAGAYRQLHPLEQKNQTVGKKLIDEILAKICNIPKQTVEDDEIRQLKTLDKRISEQVFGQQEAVDQVVSAIRFSRAGLLEDGKPLASLLFVGPTGVGKTEVANTLAKELGVELIRFDMSEYAEKHAVAKLIGAPAGYVGYEEGGLLTEAIRKKPHAVLLLDEIEKAHGDIYNILLQVMDYATLTDNQGRKADFRNVIIIMTSNAGASKVGKSQIGFGTSSFNTDAMMDEVNRIFQPEFRNRLTRIVTFSFINQDMADQITHKKLKQLANRLKERQVVFQYSKKTVDYIKEKGISREFGAREIDRVINHEVKPLLVDRILFGKLKKGGNCFLDLKDGKLEIKAD